MANTAQVTKKRAERPATTPEGRENQMIALAVNLAEERMRNGTATSAEILHYLRLATTKEKLEKEILELQKELIVAKTENLKTAKHMEELMTEAMAAMKDYSGDTEED